MKKKIQNNSAMAVVGAVALFICVSGFLVNSYLKKDSLRDIKSPTSTSITPMPSEVLAVKNRRRSVRTTPKLTVTPTVKVTTTIKPTTSVIATSTPTPTAAPTSITTSGIQTEAWIYPGPPACNSVNELKERGVHTVKIEYLSLGDTGKLNTLTQSAYGCNGYTTSNVAILKQYATEVYVTISGSRQGMITMAKNSTLRANFIQQSVNFVTTNGIQGIDIDFEEYSQWSQSDYDSFKSVMSSLGTELHKNGKKLQVDLPPIGDAEMQGNYLLKYEDFNSLPIDQFTIMAYDYQYDYGSGTPVQPRGWLSAIIDWSKAKISDNSKISIGIPAYGYSGTCKAYTPSILTYAQLVLMPGFNTAVRDPESQEMMWKYGGNCYVYSDTTTLNKKLEVVKAKGITQISVWHLGGNQWFTK